jgi:hypothetical protein
MDKGKKEGFAVSVPFDAFVSFPNYDVNPFTLV